MRKISRTRTAVRRGADLIRWYIVRWCHIILLRLGSSARGCAGGGPRSRRQVMNTYRVAGLILAAALWSCGLTLVPAFGAPLAGSTANAGVKFIMEFDEDGNGSLDIDGDTFDHPGDPTEPDPT